MGAEIRNGLEELARRAESAEKREAELSNAAKKAAAKMAFAAEMKGSNVPKVPLTRLNKTIFKLNETEAELQAARERNAELEEALEQEQVRSSKLYEAIKEISKEVGAGGFAGLGMLFMSEDDVIADTKTMLAQLKKQRNAY